MVHLTLAKVLPHQRMFLNKICHAGYYLPETDLRKDGQRTGVSRYKSRGKLTAFQNEYNQNRLKQYAV